MKSGRHGVAQQGVGAGLPAGAGGVNGGQNVGIYAHIPRRAQRWAFGRGGWATRAALDAGLAPTKSIGLSRCVVVGVVGAASLAGSSATGASPADSLCVRCRLLPLCRGSAPAHSHSLADGRWYGGALP